MTIDPAELAAILARAEELRSHYAEGSGLQVPPVVADNLRLVAECRRLADDLFAAESARSSADRYIIELRQRASSAESALAEARAELAMVKDYANNQAQGFKSCEVLLLRTIEERAAARRENERLVGLLKRYGEHKVCKVNRYPPALPGDPPLHPCTCGLDAALAARPEETK